MPSSLPLSAFGQAVGLHRAHTRSPGTWPDAAAADASGGSRLRPPPPGFQPVRAVAAAVGVAVKVGEPRPSAHRATAPPPRDCPDHVGQRFHRASATTIWLGTKDRLSPRFGTVGTGRPFLFGGFALLLPALVVQPCLLELGGMTAAGACHRRHARVLDRGELGAHRGERGRLAARRRADQAPATAQRLTPRRRHADAPPPRPRRRRRQRARPARRNRPRCRRLRAVAGPAPPLGRQHIERKGRDGRRAVFEQAGVEFGPEGRVSMEGWRYESCSSCCSVFDEGWVGRDWGARTPA